MTTFAHGYVEKTGRSGSPVITEDINFLDPDFKAVRTFEGPWADRFRFITDELFEFPVDSAGTVLYAEPKRYPDYPVAVVTSCKIRGAGKQNNLGEENQASYDRAIITVTYSTVPFKLAAGSNTSEDQTLYIEEAIDSHYIYKQIPGYKKAIKHALGIAVKDVAPFMLVIPSATILLTEIYRINPNWDAIGSIIGKVNTNQFVTPSGFVCPAGTLRYDGPRGRTRVLVADFNNPNIDLPEVWRIEHAFEYLEMGWNNDFDKNGTIVPVEKQDGELWYPTADLTSIFFGS